MMVLLLQHLQKLIMKLLNRLLSAGKHVLIEKPMTLSVEDSEELLSLSNKFDVNLMVGHVLLFHPAIKKIKELLIMDLLENYNIYIVID